MFGIKEPTEISGFSPFSVMLCCECYVVARSAHEAKETHSKDSDDNT